MLPLLPFALGLLSGAAAVGLLRNKEARGGIASAGTRLREATVSGLAAAERSSARLRERLEPELAAKAPAAAPAAKEKPAPRRRTPRKPAAPRATPRRKAASGGDQ